MTAPSRLAAFVLDTPHDVSAAAQFWAAALRRDLKQVMPGFDRYRELATSQSEPMVLVQHIEHPARIHLDIEADDVEAEVARLEALGARRVEPVRTWWVMEAPTGHRFCVVRRQRAGTHPAFPRATARHTWLASLAGTYVGETKTWLDPSGAPDVSPEEVHVRPLLGGRFVAFESLGAIGGQARSGELRVGFHVDLDRWEATLIDSFHTGTSVLVSNGRPREDGVVEVLGHYAAGPELWGWRTELSADGDTLTWRAFNVSPASEVYPATEAILRRVGR
jgi:hypothetical protein